MYRGKRIFDLAVTFTAIPLAIPLVSLSGMLLFILSGKKPFFEQKRPGYLEMEFTLYKLRTLYPSSNHSAPCNRLGKILRKYSLDEIPQFYNILKGEMSVVGPRPLLIEYLPLYNKDQKRRHLCRPGITGWAQIHGRNLLDWPERFKLDVWYVEHQSLKLDLKILVFSGLKLIDTSDVKPEGLTDQEKFKGNF